MALRAGYYGVKRFLRDKLETIVETYDDTIKSLFPRSEQAVLGAKNLLNTSNILNLYIDTTNMKYASQGTPNICVAKVQPNTKYIITKKAGTNFRVATSQNYPANDVVITNTYANHTGTEIQITTGANDYYLGVYTTEDDFPTCMVRLATDPDPIYAPYAMTNKELTDSAADQKTAINAIITAATGAADFAAFKTAMGAITPVTRSLSFAKEDITEEVKEDVEPEKTVTKKRTTKKTEEE